MKRKRSVNGLRRRSGSFQKMGYLFLIGAFLMTGTSSTFAQNLNGCVTVKCKVLEEALNQIEKQSGFTFLLATTTINPSLQLRLDCERLPMKEVLKK